MNTISRGEYVERRQRLMSALDEHAVVMLPAATLSYRNRDSEYAFRQSSDFHYLTGFPEPDALLVLLPDGNGSGRSILFCLPRDPEQEVWNGYRYGPEGAVKDFDFDEAYSLDVLDEQMLALIDGRRSIHFPLAQEQGLSASIHGWRQALQRKYRSAQPVPQVLHDLEPRLHELRLIKSDAEQALMRTAGALSAQAHIKAMQHCRPGLMEYQLEALILHHFAEQGARWPAYNSIVGGGANGCILHYTENRDPLRDGDLVLIDAGAEVQCYAGDITRTFPVNGRFSDDQKALYEVVLEAQLAAIEVIRPGQSWNLAHERAVWVLTAGLVRLGILQGEPQALVDAQAYRPFYMHRTGHWLGLDVHDVGEYKDGENWRALQAGMVLTVEPGLYIAPDCLDVDARWRGIGIRIEDDVLVTDSGCEVLTALVPKTVAEIEQLMVAASRGRQG